MAREINDSLQHEIVFYQMEDTNVCVNVIYKDETF